LFDRTYARYKSLNTDSVQTQTVGFIVNSISIRSTEEPDPSLILSVTKPYFAKVQTQQAVERYCRTSSLGPALHHFAYWGERLAGLVSAFPFPLVIDGERVVIWVPELGSLHEDVALQASRPDIFGRLLDELIRSARERGVVLVQTWPTPLAMNSFRKKGFRCVNMSLTKVKWPLTANCLSDSLSKAVSVRFGRRSKVTGIARWLAPASRLVPLKALAKVATSTSIRYKFQAIPIQSITNLCGDLEALGCADRRIYVPWDANFLSSRLREEDGHEFLSIIDCQDGKTVGWLIIRIIEEGFVIVDGIPAGIYASGRFWVSLLRYAINRGAEYMYVRLYHNNSAHCAALNVIRYRTPGATVNSQTVVAVLALDKKVEFGYDPSLWAGSDMLHLGF
jgi:hypothetical protein